MRLWRKFLSVVDFLPFSILGKQQSPTVNECPGYAFASKLQENAEANVDWKPPTWFNSQGSEEIINNYSPGNPYSSSVVNKNRTFCRRIFQQNVFNLFLCYPSRIILWRSVSSVLQNYKSGE